MTAAYDSLTEALRQLKQQAAEIRADLRGVNDLEFGDKLLAALDMADRLAALHLPAPYRNVTQQAQVLVRAVRNVRPPPVDPDLQDRTATRDLIRSANGSLRNLLDDVQDAAQKVWPSLPIPSAFKRITDGAALDAFIRKLGAFQTAVDTLAAEKDSAPTFEQQGQTLTFYAADTRLVIDLTRLHLKLIEQIDGDPVNETELDLGAMDTTVETMSETAGRVRDTFRAWRDNASPGAVLGAEHLAAVAGELKAAMEALAGRMGLPEMVLIPAGTFTMGIPLKESQREGFRDLDNRSRPEHAVTFERPFLLGRYPVTNAEYADFAREKDLPWTAPEGEAAARLPAVDIGFADAKAYARWLSERTGHRYRLPTEAEWEYACRAGTVTAQYWGDAFEPAMANPGLRRLTAVDAYPPNPWGLHDMLGNAGEWVEDTWHNNYRGAPLDGTAWVVGGKRRVVRGGFLDVHIRDNRGGVRFRIDGVPSRRVGFRLARTL